MKVPNTLIPICKKELLNYEKSLIEFKINGVYSVKIQNTTIEIRQNNLTLEKVDAIAFGSNSLLVHNGGLAKSIMDAAGE